MKYKPPKKKSRGKNPETKIYERIRDHLRYKGWFVQNIHGNIFQSGLPDMFCSHPNYPNRWVELKTPTRSNHKHGGLAPNQISKFKEMEAAGCGVWILTRVEDWHILMGPPNWKSYATGGSKIVRPKGF